MWLRKEKGKVGVLTRIKSVLKMLEGISVRRADDGDDVKLGRKVNLGTAHIQVGGPDHALLFPEVNALERVDEIALTRLYLNKT